MILLLQTCIPKIGGESSSVMDGSYNELEYYAENPVKFLEEGLNAKPVVWNKIMQRITLV